MDVIDRLVRAEGEYLGTGTDRRGRECRAELEIRREVAGAGVSLSYAVKGRDEATLHQEQMLIGHTRDGNLYLWALDSSTEQIRQHSLREAVDRDGGERVRFGCGESSDDSTQRQEIQLEFDGEDVSIEIARAEPGAPLEVESRARLVPERFYSLREDSETDQLAYREFEERPDADVAERVAETSGRIYGPDVRLELDDEGFWAEGEPLHLAVAELQGEVVGFQLARGTSRREARILRGGVVPEFRGDQVASELLVRQVRWAREREFRRLSVELVAGARERMVAYLRGGFRVIGTSHPAGRRGRVELEYDLQGDDSSPR